MKIGIFGGTFDPPHIGHQILAAEAVWQLNLDSVLWVLTTFPPHKKQPEITPLEHRVKMVEYAIEGNPKFILSRVDIDRNPPHYAVDTVKILKKQTPKDEFYYLMGLDSLNDLSAWHEPIDFINACDGIGVMLRTGEEFDITSIESIFPELGKKIHILSAPMIEISSTKIRERIKNGADYRYYVPFKVYQNIQKMRLYIV